MTLTVIVMPSITGLNNQASTVGNNVAIPATVNPSRNTVLMGTLALLAVLWPLAARTMSDRRTTLNCLRWSLPTVEVRRD